MIDADRFDALSRALSTPRSRRTALSALLGALLGKALPGPSLEAAAARKQNGRDVGAAACVAPGAKRCRKDIDCCATPCKRKKRKCLPCPAGTEYCETSAACVDLQTDHANCGSCGHDCGTQVCESGLCTDIGVTCDPCPQDLVCEGSTGLCRCPAERPVVCPFRNGGYCSANLSTDPERCGQFCETCAAGGNCCNGSCVYGCGPGVTPASSSCGTEPCGGGCEVCTDGKYCCNLGPGTASKCVLPSGGQCPPA